MKTTITYTSLNVEVPWPALLAEQLDRWQSLTPITAAEVILEHQRNDALAFRVKVRLEVLGPGFRADASDATLEGALLLATRDLDTQIQARKVKSLAPAKSTLQPGAISGRKTVRKV